MTSPFSADRSRPAPLPPERPSHRGGRARCPRPLAALLGSLLALLLSWGAAQPGPAFPERTEVMLTDPSGTRFVGYGIVEDRALHLSVGDDAWPERLVLTLVLPDGSMASYPICGAAPEDLAVVVDGRARPLGELLVGDGVALEVDRVTAGAPGTGGRPDGSAGGNRPDDRPGSSERAGGNAGPGGGAELGNGGRSDERGNGRNDGAAGDDDRSNGGSNGRGGGRGRNDR